MPARTLCPPGGREGCRRHGAEPPWQAKGRDGFTLLELIVVLVVIVTLAGLVAPRFSNFFPSLQVQKTADRLLAWAGKARADAALTGLRHRLVFETLEKRYWIEIEARPLKDPGVFTILGGSWEEEDIPEEVDLETLEGLEPDPDFSNRRCLEFRPDGTSADATIVVSNDRGDRKTIKVVGATSRIHIEPSPEQP